MGPLRFIILEPTSMDHRQVTATYPFCFIVAVGLKDMIGRFLD
ncbi:MAG: hypothetical protein ACI936_000812 [Paraglaciecola sp.]|jgi:hypothetical protein